MLWVGFTEIDSETSAAQPLLMHLSYSGQHNLRDFGTVPEAEYLEELANWEFDGTRSPLAQRKRAKQFGHAARVFAGLDYTIEETKRYEREQEAHRNGMEWYRAQPVVIVPPSAPKGRMVELKDVVD